MSNKEAVMTMISTLSATDLKDVRTVLENAEDNAQPDICPMLQYSEVFYKILLAEINRVTASSVKMPFAVFRKGKMWGRFMTEYETTYKLFCDNHIGSKHSLQVAMSSFYMLVAKLIIEDLEKRDKPVTVQMCVYRMDAVSALINRAFPGYIAAGLLSRIL